MWSRWCAKQCRGIVPLRLLTSGSRDNGQPKFAQKLAAARSSIDYTGMGALAVAVVSLYFTNEEFKKTLTYNKYLVNKAFRRRFSMPLYKLPQLERNDLYENVLSLSSEKILLIEGASGTGKTAAVQKLLHDVSKPQKSPRGVLYHELFMPVSSLDNFFNGIVIGCGGQIGSFSSFAVLSQACEESFKANNGNRPLLVIDNAQELALNDMVFREIMGHLRGLMGTHKCDVILIVSNGTILKKARQCSGLSSRGRLDYLSWPHVPDKEMSKYISENLEKIFQKATVSESQIARFVKLFDSSFTELVAVKDIEDLDSYMETKLTDRRADLRKVRYKQKEHFAVLKQVYNANNHKTNSDEIRFFSDAAEELVMLKFLAHVDDNNYIFHDRLTLQAMAAEMAEEKAAELATEKAAEMKALEEKAAETKSTSRTRRLW